MSFTQFILILLARKRIIFYTLLVIVTTTTVISLLMQPTYVATASVLIDYKSYDPISGIALPSQPLSDYMATQEDIITSHNVALKVVERQKFAEEPKLIEQFNKSNKGRGSLRDWLADNLLRNLKVQLSRQSRLINISYSAKDPQVAADLANAFVDAYTQTTLELRVEPARQQVNWFDEQIKGIRTHVEDLQKKLADYQQETGVIAQEDRLDRSDRLDIENARLAEISSQLVTAQTQTYDSITRQRQIKGASAKDKLGELPEISNNNFIQNLKVDLSKAEGKFAELSQRVDKNHPQYQRAQVEVQILRQRIKAEIQSARGTMENVAAQAQLKEEELKKSLAEQKARVIALKQQRGRGDLLNQELASARGILESTTQRTNQIRLESQRDLTDIVVLNSAVAPLRYSKPNLQLNIAVSIFLGTLLGVGFGFLSEMLSRRIYSAEDITEGMALPVLAVIPSSLMGKSPGLFRRTLMQFHRG